MNFEIEILYYKNDEFCSYRGHHRCDLNAKFIIFNATFIIFNAKFIIFNATFIIFNATFIIFNATFIIFNARKNEPGFGQPTYSRTTNAVRLTDLLCVRSESVKIDPYLGLYLGR